MISQSTYMTLKRGGTNLRGLLDSTHTVLTILGATHHRLP
jgi:hypothetical protein